MKLLHVISNADLRSRNKGLLKQASTHGCPQKTLKPGDIVAFINSKRTSISLVSITEQGGLGVLGYWKAPSGRVPPEAIEFIPAAFGGGSLDMTRAVRLGLEKLLARTSRPRRKRAPKLSPAVARLSEQIAAAGLKKWWVAEQAGVPRSTLQRWLSGKFQPNEKEGASWERVCRVVAKEVRP